MVRTEKRISLWLVCQQSISSPCCSSRSELKITSILKFDEPPESVTLFILTGFENIKFLKLFLDGKNGSN